MENLTDNQTIKDKLEVFSNLENTILIIDGKTIETIEKDKVTLDYFFSVATLSKSVICCRCSPT